ncbi:hypothetical protein EDD29_8628 [Actinocorallia herbida]|uniref:Uncharacterized protein n=1 Tax=Actinocorallia herbida TaxID=58109 RepID=A0A3N1DBI1_9ACTN|nr:hypothetical protein [Actinocorallia herbida]ROO90887.1 hypothetical protein EDD29_8628 [Actinocorallia herbida]
MWDYEGFVAKAQLYFHRAESAHSADDAAVTWLLLGLEFLMRSPLAKIHPTLLADPTGDSIMHAAGYPAAPRKDGALPQPKSITATTVRLRLSRIVPDFATVDEEAAYLLGLRNAELHTSSSALNISDHHWLPKFVRVTEVLCAHLHLDPDDVVGEELMRHGRGLAAEADKKLRHEVSERIRLAKAYFNSLPSAPPQEAPPAKMFPSWAWTMKDYEALKERITEKVPCPACGSDADETLELARATREQLIDDQIVRDVVYLATALACPGCNLSLTSNSEIAAADLEQQRTWTVETSIQDRYLEDYEPDYGND